MNDTLDEIQSGTNDNPGCITILMSYQEMDYTCACFWFNRNLCWNLYSKQILWTYQY